MKVVIQRVKQAKVEIENKIYSEIGKGLLVLVGFCNEDNKEKIEWIANKINGLRIFSDENNKMNLSVKDINGEILIVSNFTLYGELNKGYRPSFSDAANPELAIPLYEYFINYISNFGIPIKTGIFGAMMDINLINDGPVTIILEK
jgi:D-tyrosyl-tRNA(Tyr) deacylase